MKSNNMMKSALLTLFIACIVLISTPIKVYSAGFDDIVNKLDAKNKQLADIKNKEKEVSDLAKKKAEDEKNGVGVALYSDEEMIKVLAVYRFIEIGNAVYQGPNFLKKQYANKSIEKKEIIRKTLGFDYIDDNKIVAFNRKYYDLERCGRYFHPFSYSDRGYIDQTTGIEIILFAIDYVVAKNANRTGAMDVSITGMKKKFEELKFASNYCSPQDFDKYTKNLKSFIDFIFENEEKIIGASNKLVKAGFTK